MKKIKKSKYLDEYAKLIQSIKREYQQISAEKDRFQKLIEQSENKKQFRYQQQAVPVNTLKRKQKIRYESTDNEIDIFVPRKNKNN